LNKIIKIYLLAQFIFITNTYSQNKISYAVLNLKSLGISNSEAQILTDRLRNNLVNLKEFRVLDRENMDVILKEQGFQLSGCTTTECAVEAGKLLNVHKIITGSVGKFSLIYTISLKIIDIETGEIENSIYYDYKGEMEDLLYTGINISLRKLLGQIVKDSGQFERLNIKNGYAVGNKALPFRFQTLTNNFYSLSDFYNNSNQGYNHETHTIIILHFWASYRYECSKSFKFLVGLQKEFSHKKLKVLHINYGQTRNNVSDFAEKYNLPGSDVVPDISKKISVLYNIESIPAIIVIDQFGIIQKRIYKWNKFSNGFEIETLVKEN